MLGTNEIDARFRSYKVSNEQVEAQSQTRRMARNLARHINVNLPDGREKSLALTKLEECVMWANRGIAIGQECFGREDR